MLHRYSKTFDRIRRANKRNQIVNRIPIKLGRVPFQILHIFKSKRFSNQTNSTNDTTAHFSNHRSLLLDKQKQHAPVSCGRGSPVVDPPPSIPPRANVATPPLNLWRDDSPSKKKKKKEKKTKDCSRIDNTTLHRGRVADVCAVLEDGGRRGESLGEETPSARKRR